jgi:hypothetical protein
MPYTLDMEPVSTAWGSPTARIYVPRRRHFRPVASPTGLGAGEPTVSAAAGEGSSVASTLISVGALTGPVGWAIAGGAAVAALLTHFLGGGCGEPCIDAAKVEQIYEAAANNLMAVGKLGMISKTEAISGMQTLMQAGQQHEAQLGAQPHSKAGAANLSKVIAGEITAAQSLADTPTVPIDLNRARGVYMSGHGWYPDSLAAAAQWTDTFLTSVASSRPAPSAISSAGQQIAQALGLARPSASSPGISPLFILAGAAILIFFLMRK